MFMRSGYSAQTRRIRVDAKVRDGWEGEGVGDWRSDMEHHHVAARVIGCGWNAAAGRGAQTGGNALALQLGGADAVELDQVMLDDRGVANAPLAFDDDGVALGLHARGLARVADAIDAA